VPDKVLWDVYGKDYLQMDLPMKLNSFAQRRLFPREILLLGNHLCWGLRRRARNLEKRGFAQVVGPGFQQ